MGTSGAVLMYTEVEVIRIDSKYNRVRERSKGAEADWRAAVNRDEFVVGRENTQAKRICDSL